MRIQKLPHRGISVWTLCILLVFLGAGCKEDLGEPAGSNVGPTTKQLDVPKLNLTLPDNLAKKESGTPLMGANNGGSFSAMNNSLPTRSSSDEPNCKYVNGLNDDMFRHGYHLTKYLSQVGAAYSCFADWVMKKTVEWDIPTDGKVYDVKANKESEPTGVSVVKDSPTQHSLRFFYRKKTEDPGWLVSWKKNGEQVSGRIVFDNDVVRKTLNANDDPRKVRIDFIKTNDQLTLDIYALFPTHNKTESFRMNLIKKLTGSDTESDKIKIKGYLITRVQPYKDSNSSSITDQPVFKIAAISDANGKGGTVTVVDKLLMGSSTYGYFLTQFKDKFAFTNTQPSEWIKKTMQNAELKISGPQSGCNSNSTCTAKWNTWIQDPAISAQLEMQNAGSEPNDARSDFANNFVDSQYLDQVYPDRETSWNSVFDMRFD